MAIETVVVGVVVAGIGAYGAARPRQAYEFRHRFVVDSEPSADALRRERLLSVAVLLLGLITTLVGLA